MRTMVTADAAEFRDRVFPFLHRDPVLHTIILTNVQERAEGAYRAESGESVFVSVHDDTGAVAGAVMRTPGRPAYLGGLRPELAPAVAEVYAEQLPDLSGIAGSRPAVEAFRTRWLELRGGNAVEGRSTRLHRLVELVRLPAPGSARRATEDDAALAGAWVAPDFGAEIADLGAWALDRIRTGTLWFWEAGGTPVSLAGYHLPVFGVCRVGPVYTPPEHRRNGYAGALTAHVTGEIVASGNLACLYTDLANPTANNIYHAAGYRPVADFVDLTFTP